MSQPVLMHLPLAELVISKLNMRHGRTRPDVSDLLPSVRSGGVRQTLLVRKEGDHYGVIAGRRRFFALQEIAKDIAGPVMVPCAIIEDCDDAEAIEASLAENIARLPATELEQFEAFRKLHGQGVSVDDIAIRFGVTELNVKRVLALAALSAPIRRLYGKGDIDRVTAQALTLATTAQQAAWLKLWNSEDERAPLGRACKAWVTGGASICSDKALFDLSGFDGQVIADLFGETAVFANANVFWKAQCAAIALRVEAYRASGWTDVIVMERGDCFRSWEHVNRTKRRGSKVFAEIRHDGTVIFHEGFVTQAEDRKAARVKRDDEAGGVEAAAPGRPEMSGPLAKYIFLHRHAGAQASLITAPGVALRLMLAHALCGSSLWQVRRHECPSRREATLASHAASPAVHAMAAARADLAAKLEAAGLSMDEASLRSTSLFTVFAILLRWTDAEVMRMLAFVMADSLESGTGIAEAVLQVCKTDLVASWAPDEAFFDLIRDKRVLHAMLTDIGSKSLADSVAGETAAVQKQVIRDRIKGASSEPRPDWRPGWMQVPPKRVVDGAPSPVIEAWESAERAFYRNCKCDTDTLALRAFCGTSKTASPFPKANT